VVIDLWNTIKSKRFSPVYLLYGEEEYFIKKTKALICEHALSADEAEFNLATVDLEETPVELAIEELETLPFIGERRVVILHNPTFLTAERKKEKVDHDLKRLESYLANPSPTSIAIFIAPYPKLDERKKITKELKRNSAVLEAKPLYEKELSKWIMANAKSLGVKISPEAVETLLSLTGNHLMMAAGELEKLALYATVEQEIDKEMVNKLVPKSFDQNVFDLVDYIMNGQKKEAILLYKELLILKEEPIRILAAIARQYRIILQVKKLSGQGYSAQQIASKLKMSPYPVKLALKRVNDFSEMKLMRALAELAELDFRMKSGAGDKEILLELFILKS
jgi:DNA polymerase-3 subunit delta